MEARYELMEKVGEGSYGSVFRAMKKETGEMVAIKILKKTASLESPREWEQELRPLIQMKYVPNIVKLKEFFLDKNKPVFVFEYMDRTLLDLMRARAMRPFSEPEIRHWCIQVFTGLAHMHQNGYFHQDLKPENFLLKQDTIKIGDLVSARDIRESPPPYSSISGTLWYRSPESLRHTGFYDSKVDMWAMGAIMAEMFTGRPLFPGNSETDQLSIICRFTGQFEYNLVETIPNASAEAISLIKWLCSWDPRDRPTAVEALGHPFFRSRCILSLGPKTSVAAKGPPPGFGTPYRLMAAIAAASAARSVIGVRGPATPGYGFESSCGSRLMARVRGPPPGFEYARLQ